MVIDMNYNSGIEFYRRYVDDTFALFNTEEDALSFYSYINIQHPNIKFTMEREETTSSPSQMFFKITIAIRALSPRSFTRRPTLVFSLIFIVLYLPVTN